MIYGQVRITRWDTLSGRVQSERILQGRLIVHEGTLKEILKDLTKLSEEDKKGMRFFVMETRERAEDIKKQEQELAKAVEAQKRGEENRGGIIVPTRLGG